MMKDNYTEMKEIAKEQNIPIRINLYTRAKKCETVLDLVGYAISKDYSFESEFNYQIGASFPYSLYGEDGDYISIDFSEGPNVHVGDKLGRMRVKSIEPPLIVCTKA
jgi:hypothetical protein